MRGHAVSASSFCIPYLATTQTATTGFPTFLSACSASPSKLSSGCSCFQTTSSSATSSTAAPSCTSTITITPLVSTVTVTLSPSPIVTPPSCPSASTVTSVSTFTTTVTATPSCSLEIVGGNFDDPATGDLNDFEISSNPSNVGFFDVILTPSQQNAFSVPAGVDQFL
ncbi:hypothetical protein N431DRAFT_213955 [Stipitochalara longipes BDJ]|nr:hypothetical protein N431DRAFT_213955 [Stipitochalara longipes BDJ]